VWSRCLKRTDCFEVELAPVMNWSLTREFEAEWGCYVVCFPVPCHSGPSVCACGMLWEDVGYSCHLLCDWVLDEDGGYPPVDTCTWWLSLLCEETECLFGSPRH